MEKKMERSSILTDFQTRKRAWVGVVAIVLIAVMACGAVGGTKNHKGKKGGPLAAVEYDPNFSLAPLVERVGPAVVNIKTTQKIRTSIGTGGSEGLFEWFFGPGQRRRFRGEPRQRERTMQAAGSGFIIDKSGLVVTNHHVVANADEIEVQLADEKIYKATLVGSDERTDVALLRLNGARNLPTVGFGDSDALRVGDRVVAIGNPFGLDHTVTSGIVSAKERVIGAGPYDNFIQTDASINPGNSGGPLFNLSGEVVGINTAIARQGQGIGFAIPSSLADRLITSLRQDGTVVRGWLGVGFQPLDESLSRAFGTKVKGGALVTFVQEGSPAEQGGFKYGDVILEVDGKPLASARQLPGVVAGLRPGKKTIFKVLRDGSRLNLKVKIERMVDETALDDLDKGSKGEAEHARIGISVGDLTAATRKKLGMEESAGGVLVKGVRASGGASKFLRAGDVIVEINRDKVSDVAHFEKLASKLKKGDDLLLRVYRRGSWIYGVVRL